MSKVVTDFLSTLIMRKMMRSYGLKVPRDAAEKRWDAENKRARKRLEKLGFDVDAAIADVTEKIHRRRKSDQ